MHQKSEAIIDYVTPDYVDRSARGEIINNPMTYTLSELHTDGGATYSANWLSNGSCFQKFGSTGSLTQYMASAVSFTLHSTETAVMPHGIVKEDLHSVAKFKAIGHLDSTPYEFAEDVAEIRETLRFLRNPLQGLRKLSTRFRRRALNKRAALGDAKALADAWTEYRFALSPLIRSSMDIHDALSRKQWTRPPRRTARGFSQKTFDKKEVYVDRKVHFHTWKYKKVAVKAGILYSVSNPVLDLNFKTGLRVKDIPETVWAIVPYSFMVDRVVDLSTMIRGLTNLLDPSLSILAGWSTEKDDVILEDTVIAQDHTSLAISISGDPYRKHVFAYDRQKWGPTVADAVPTVDTEGLVSDATKIADLAALIVQNLRPF